MDVAEKERAMPAKKKASEPPVANGHPASAQARRDPRPAKMTDARLERRVSPLEEQITRLESELAEVRGNQTPWWQKISGSFANDPAHVEAMRLGREWRETSRPESRR
jgi:hypothetical protein